MACRRVAGGFCSRLSRLSSFPISAARRASAVAHRPEAASRFLSPSRVLSRPLPLAPCRRVSFNVQDGEDFTERVINSDVPVLVDFHAQWCGPCKILGPRLEKAVAKQQGRVVMAKVDIDEHTDLAIEYGVRVGGANSWCHVMIWYDDVGDPGFVPFAPPSTHLNPNTQLSASIQVCPNPQISQVQHP
uniref:Thioredoxin 2 n=1 Tax=Paramormyrops kingsleyae TaxID=1676925 RepID=A0A3B3RUE5_9TELE